MDINQKIIEKIEELNLHNQPLNEAIKKLSLELKTNPYTISQQISSLVQEGEVIIGGKNKLVLTKLTNFKKGRFIATTKGYGFFEFEEEGHEDLFVSKENMNGARHSDIVLVKVLAPQDKGEVKRNEAQIVSICKRGVTKVVGTFYVNAKNNCGFVVSEDDSRIGDVFIPGKHMLNAKNNHKVVCEITEYNSGKNMVGKIIEVLGKKGDKAVDLYAILRKYDIVDEFPNDVKEFVKNLPDKVEPKEWQGRRTFFDNDVITIDGDFSKDFDDAVNGYVNEDGTYTVFIHIADVNHYVKANSPLDKEAMRRGTSHYPPGMVVPMYPEKLSNEICSLNEGVERLTLTCEATINSEGKILKSDIYESVIKSKHRMTYNKVRKILNGDQELRQQYEDVVPMIEILNKVAVILKEKRLRNGEIEFDLPEPDFIEDENHNVIDIKAREHGLSEELIESLMILANECVAKKYKQMQAPFVYRIHEKPTELKTEKMLSYFKRLGISMEDIKDPENLAPKDVQKLMSNLDGKPYENAVKAVLLRTMSKAKYSPECLGHYGLALKYYTHFTSPIRRYSDTAIHRIIKRDLELQRTKPELNEKQRNAFLLKEFSNFVEKASEQASATELNAQKCEREAHDFKKADFLSNHIGEVFEGKISGVMDYGIYVELDNTCEGLIRTDCLPEDNYELMPDGFTLLGKHHKYSIGDAMKVKVAKVNIENYKIDFVFPEQELHCVQSPKKNEYEKI